MDIMGRCPDVPSNMAQSLPQLLEVLATMLAVTSFSRNCSWPKGEAPLKFIFPSWGCPIQLPDRDPLPLFHFGMTLEDCSVLVEFLVGSAGASYASQFNTSLCLILSPPLPDRPYYWCSLHQPPTYQPFSQCLFQGTWTQDLHLVLCIPIVLYGESSTF